MRIISGSLKGKSVQFLKNKVTRPLKDAVKESVFNILKHSNLINVKIENSNVLDLYSGIGSFGLESISRGAKQVTFVENDNEINIFFSKKNYDLIGWQTLDIYQNLSITFLSSIFKNQKIDKSLFILPKQN